MKDRSITKLVAKFCYDILAGFDHTYLVLFYVLYEVGQA